MKIPGLKLSKGESYTDSWGSEDEIEQPHYHQQHPSLEGNGQHHLSPRSSNNDHLPPQSTVQSYGNIKMKSKNLMCHLISPRSYSKFQKEEEERERRQRVAASGTRWDQDDEDFHNRARVAPVHPNDATLDQVWLGFEEQAAPSEAYIERRKYQQAAAIDFYMKNGQQVGGDVETPEELARMAGPKVIRAAANEDAEATGDENEQCLAWVRHEQRRGETRSRSLSTGNKYDTNSKYIAKPTKHKSGKHKKGDERPMLKYY